MTVSFRLLVVALALVVARPVAGQAIVGAVAGATTSLGSNTEPAVSVSTGYRFNRLLGFGIEYTSVPKLKPDATAFTATNISTPVAAISGSGGRVSAFTTNLRVDMPIGRVIPYGVAGGGVANVRESFAVTAQAPLGLPVVIPPVSMTQSSTSMAVMAGGGVGVLLTRHLSVDVDLRYLRLMADRDRNVGRFGLGASYRF